MSAAAAAHFANPRNDFWRLLHEAGFTSRLYDPQEQFDLLKLGYGVTNAAARTTPGSGDLRRGDFDRAEFEARIRAVGPRAVAFVGKEAYRGLYRERAELGPQLRTIGSTGIYVLPSTSPANAAVPYAERLRWFDALRAWLRPTLREAVRGLVVDAERRMLLVQYENPATHDRWWSTPGGGVEAGENDEATLRRELAEELGLYDFEPGLLVWDQTRSFAWGRRLVMQRNRIYLVRVHDHEPAPTIDLSAEGVCGLRWWTVDEIETTADRLTPPELFAELRTLVP